MPAQRLDMSVHVQGFVNSVRDLPAELQRCFTMIAQLDQKCHMLKEDVDKAAMEELQKVACQVRTADNSASTGQQAGQEQAEAHEALFNRISQAIDLSEEKVTLAQQMYDYVDQRIRQFDKDMHSFDAELLAERTRLGIPESQSLLPPGEPMPRKGRAGRGQADGKRRGCRAS